MDNKFKRFHENKLSSDELCSFREELERMSDDELNTHLNSYEEVNNMNFKDSDIVEIQEKLNREIKSDRFHRFIFRCISVAAGIMLPMLIATIILLYNSNKELETYSKLVDRHVTLNTTKGENIMTILPDGSKVYMGPLSSLSYDLKSFNSKERSITYTGEGDFIIAKDKDAPFYVDADNLKITVLGTEFSLFTREKKNCSEVYLSEGSLKITSKSEKEGFIVKPGEVALINNISGSISVSPKDDNPKLHAGQQTIYFSSAPLQEIAEELEVYYGLNFKIPESLDHIIFTGSLPTDNIDQVIYTLENTLDIKIVYQNDTINLSAY